MNCCNNYGKCTGAHGCPARAESHLPCSAPPQKRYPFAPGVIEVADRCAPWTRMKLVVVTLLGLACLGALAAVVSFIAGYINLPDLHL